MPGKSRLQAVTLGTFLGLLLMVIALWMTVDDPWRDLTTSTAATAPAHADPRLQPLHSSQSVPVVARAVERALAGRSEWQLLSRRESSESIELQYLHRSAWLGWGDIVEVSVVRDDFGSSVAVMARTQSGLSDLGRSPRLIDELLTLTRAALESPVPRESPPRAESAAPSDKPGVFMKAPQ